MALGEMSGIGWQYIVTLTAAGSVTIADAPTSGRNVIMKAFIGTTGSSSSNTISIYAQGAGATAPIFRFQIGNVTGNGVVPLDFTPFGLVTPSAASRLIFNTSGTGSVTGIFLGMTRE